MKKTNHDLLKEAIADAKTIKETALASAKASLEESFTPHLKSMLAKKIEEMDMEDEDVEIEESFDDLEREEETEKNTSEDLALEENEENEDEEVDIETLMAELESDETLTESEEEEDLDEAKKDEESEEEESEETEENEELDLENLSEEDLKKFIEEVMQELIDSGEIELNPEAEEDLDLDMGEEGEGEEGEDFNMLQNTLNESLKLIKNLQSELKETNLLNSKLLYSNKILRSKNLNESQKVKVLKAFDKATTPKEAKLIYESLNYGIEEKTPLNNRRMGFASKTVNTHQKSLKENLDKKNIIDTDPIYARFKVLAGLK